TKKNFIEYKIQFPNSPFSILASQQIYKLEEDNCWYNASKKNTLYGYLNYLDNYSEGRFVSMANQNIQILLKNEELDDRDKEDYFWEDVKKLDKIKFYKKYIETYSSGKYHDEANKRINSLSQELKSKTWGKNKEVVGVFFLLIIFLCYKWYFVPDSNPHHFEPNFDRVKSYIQSGELSKAYEEIKLALDDQDLVTNQ